MARMAKLATVAIVGKPNAGKSTLFNALTGTRQAIVTDVPGTTRDHVGRRVDDEIPYLLVDTGGIGGGSLDEDLEDDVSAQSILALEQADIIIFTVSIRDDITSSDVAVAEILRRKSKRHVPVIVALTKADSPKFEERLSQYYELGIGDVLIPLSAVHKSGIGELTDAVQEFLKKLHFQPEKEPDETAAPRIALVGRPNVGKSSLINAYMSEADRKKSPRLVSDIPGTTRDPSDTVVRHDGKEFIFVDTAGMRRRSRVEDGIEGLSHFKSMQAIANSDIVVLVLEAPELISKQEKRIAAQIIDEGKALILLMNKGDLLTGEEKQEREIALRHELPFCGFAPSLYVSATTKDGILKLFALLETAHRNLHRRLPSADLRRWYDACMQRVPAKALTQGKHITQAKDIPPTFVIFAKDPRAVQKNHLRYLDHSLRSTFGFDGVPIRWIVK